MKNLFKKATLALLLAIFISVPTGTAFAYLNHVTSTLFRADGTCEVDYADGTTFKGHWEVNWEVLMPMSTGESAALCSAIAFGDPGNPDGMM